MFQDIERYRECSRTEREIQGMFRDIERDTGNVPGHRERYRGRSRT